MQEEITAELVLSKLFGVLSYIMLQYTFVLVLCLQMIFMLVRSLLSILFWLVRSLICILKRKSFATLTKMLVPSFWPKYLTR